MRRTDRGADREKDMTQTLQENNPKNEQPHTPSLAMAETAVRKLLEKKAKEVKLYDVSAVSSVTDVYINATGRSSSHVGSLADDVVEALSAAGKEPLHVEGRRGQTWVLADYGDIVINIFDAASRDFYQLDRLMPDTSLCDISALKEEVDRKFDISVKDI